MNKSNIRKGYIDIIDFDHHLENDVNPVHVFSSLKLIKENKKCAKHCGIYEVEIKVKKIALKGKERL